jgi:hypothetical protein
MESDGKVEDALVSIEADKTPFFDSVNVLVKARNLKPGELVNLSKYASEYALADNHLLATNAKIGLLGHAITFAQNQGLMSLEARALTKNTQEVIDIKSTLRYDEDSAALITQDNALSLMHYAKASFQYSAPTWQTEALLPPNWMMAVRAFLKQDGDRYTSIIEVEDMDAVVNGTPLPL